MRIKLLCVGDVVGSPGRRAVAVALPRLVQQHGIACTIVNAENVASGSGITPAIYDKLIKSGVHLMTLGDHIYRRREIISVLETSDRVCRPANLAPNAPGKEFALYETANGVKVAVFSLLGRLYMKVPVDCPFRAAERVLSKIPSGVRVIVCDVHAEATSEKVALGWFLDGKVSVIFGTHTHIPTSDAKILPNGAGYITDLGMTGPYDSVLGRQKEQVLQAMITSVPVRFDVAEGDSTLSGIIAEVSADSGRCTQIDPVSEHVAADTNMHG